MKYLKGHYSYGLYKYFSKYYDFLKIASIKTTNVIIILFKF
jgi:hypothetical protein